MNSAEVKFIGPYTGGHYKISIGGYLLRGVTAALDGESTWKLTLDGRFQIEASDDEARRWIWWVANAMAISAGYTCFGKNCRRSNPFTTQIMGLGADDDMNYSLPHPED